MRKWTSSRAPRHLFVIATGSQPHIGKGLENFQLPFKLSGFPIIISVQEGNQRTSGAFDSQISSTGRSAIGFANQGDAVAKPGKRRLKIIRAAIIDHQDLIGASSLGKETLDRTRDDAGRLVRGDDDAHNWVNHGLASNRQIFQASRLKCRLSTITKVL